MCVIVDANLASLVFAPLRDLNPDFLSVRKWLDPGKRGCLVFGGQLARELNKVANARRYLRVLAQAGRARQIPDAKSAAEEARIAKTGLCKSDDPHVIALALLSGARTLCSHDQKLHADFTNPAIISKPRGVIYQNATHFRLLRHTSSCKQDKVKR